MFNLRIHPLDKDKFYIPFVALYMFSSSSIFNDFYLFFFWRCFALFNSENETENKQNIWQ